MEPFSCHGDLETIAKRATHIPLSRVVVFFFFEISFPLGKKIGKQFPILVSQIASLLIRAKRLVPDQRALILPCLRLYLAWHTWTPPVCASPLEEFLDFFSLFQFVTMSHRLTVRLWIISPREPLLGRQSYVSRCSLLAARCSDLISVGSDWSLDSRILLLARISCSAARASLLSLRPLPLLPAQCLCSHFQTVFLLAASHKIPQQWSLVSCHVADSFWLMKADG